MADVRFLRGTRADLPASRNANTLYYVTNTGEFFMGELSFSRAVRTGFASLPATFATGVLYVLSNGSGWTHDGTGWVPIFTASDFDDKDVVEIINSASPSHDNIPTEQAVVEHVEIAITEELEELGVAHNITFNTATHILTIPMAGRAALVVDIGALIVGGITGGHYDAATQEIVLVLADGTEIRIPAGDLIKTYVSGSTATDTIQVTIVYDATDGEYRISSTIRVAASTLLTIAANGELTFNDAAITTIVNNITALEARIDDLEEGLTWGSFTD